jgi:hypothetical protein
MHPISESLMRLSLALLLAPTVCMVACGESDKDDDDDDEDDGEQTDTDAGDDTGGSGGDDGGDGGGGGDGSLLDPDVRSALDRVEGEVDGDTSDCEQVDGHSVPGALSTFVGAYRDNGSGSWVGGERWVMHANQAWREAGVDDCVITWTMAAIETSPPGTCSGCDLGLDVLATLDQATTDCPEGLWEDDRSWAASYGVRRSGAEATWVHGSSGNPLGVGAVDGDSMDFTSASACIWF